ncbi:MAG: hypothetical protein IJU79_01170 [Desulfovibrionaceae bacterium]|nr:hypothetical protein [Desulfovibrionaceae bacterium]
MLTPREIREPLLRAQGYLKSAQPVQAMQAMSQALRAMQGRSLSLLRTLTKPIQDFLAQLEASPRIQILLDGCVPDDMCAFPYRLGQEGTLAVVLEGLVKILQRQEQYIEDKQKAALIYKRRDTLFETGKTYLTQGALALALAFFSKMVQEFAEEPDIWQAPAKLLENAACKRELATFYERVLEVQPKNAEVYSRAINVWLELEAYPEAERLFIAFAKTFGRHPRTLSRMAQFYLHWGHLEQAESLAKEALSKDSTLKEALVVLKIIKDTA